MKCKICGDEYEIYGFDDEQICFECFGNSIKHKGEMIEW